MNGEGGIFDVKVLEQRDGFKLMTGRRRDDPAGSARWFTVVGELGAVGVMRIGELDEPVKVSGGHPALPATFDYGVHRRRRGGSECYWIDGGCEFQPMGTVGHEIGQQLARFDGPDWLPKLWELLQQRYKMEFR